MRRMMKFRVRTGVGLAMFIGVILGLFVSLSGMRHRRNLCAIEAQRYRVLEKDATDQLARQTIVLSKLKSGAYPDLSLVQRQRAIRSMSRYVEQMERTVEWNRRLRIAFEDVVDHPWRKMHPTLLHILNGD